MEIGLGMAISSTEGLGWSVPERGFWDVQTGKSTYRYIDFETSERVMYRYKFHRLTYLSQASRRGTATIH